MRNNKIKIAVTGIGGGVGQSIIKSLYNTPYSLIGLDSETLATGAYCVSRSHIIPYARNKNFIPKLLEICKKEKCRLLFPGLDAELPYLAANTKKFEKIGTTIVVSNPNTIKISDNKLLTYSALTKVGIKVPMTMNLCDYINTPTKFPHNYPFILKPKQGGARSKDVIKITNQKQLQTLINTKDCKKYVLQEYIKGDEYTCGTVSLNNQHMGTIIMRRFLRDGDTYKAFVEKNTVIEKAVAEVINFLKPFGAINVQLRLKNGQPYIFEINARCSGTTAARSIAGFNEPKMIADYLIFNKVPKFKIKEIAILRYWKELAIENKSIKVFEKNKVITNKSINKL